MHYVHPVLQHDEDKDEDDKDKDDEDAHLDWELAGIITGVSLIASNHAKVCLGVGMPATLYEALDRTAGSQQLTSTSCFAKNVYIINT